jgi:hypothetical protein
MNTEEIEKRNLLFLESMIEKYNLKITLDDLIEYQSVFLLYPVAGEWGFRLMATFIEQEKILTETFSKDGEVTGAKLIQKQQKVNLYNFLKRKIEKHTEEEIIQVREDFIKLEYMWKELYFIKQLRIAERNLSVANFFARDKQVKKMKPYFDENE